MASSFVPTETCLWTGSPFFHDRHASSLLPMSSDLNTTPSFFVTLKVLQIVHSLCKRATKHVRSASSPSTLPNKRRVKARQTLCQPFELEAYDKIDNYLGRKTRRNHHQKQTNDRCASTGTICQVNLEPLTTSCITKRITHQIDKKSPSEWYALEAVARSNKLFVRRDKDFDLQPLSLHELSHHIIATRDLLDTLSRVKHGYRVRTLCEGNEILDADETYIANLQHLLLCLYHQLLRLLVDRLVQLAHKHLKDSQKDQEKQWLDWFFEFPDARHPLSTTWPWSIRPSLAVIWGVCWMFFDPADYRIDKDGNMVDVHGTIVVPYQYSDTAQQYLRSLQARRGSHQSGSNDNGDSRSGGGGGGDGSNGGGLRSPFQQELTPGHVPTWTEQRHPQQLDLHRHVASPTATHNLDFDTTDIRARGLRGGLGTTSTNPSSTATAHAAGHWLPQENFDTTSTLPYHQFHPAQASADVLHAWPLDFVGDESSHLPQPPPPPPVSRQTPVIRVQTADLPTFSQPQDNNYFSATSAVSSASSLYHSDDFYAHGHNSYSNNPYNQNNLSPHSPLPPSMSQDLPGVVMHTPVSPISPQPHNHPDAHTMSQLVRELVEGANRKRSFSEMSQNGRPQMHPVEHAQSRAVSVVSAAQEETSPAADQDSPRGSRSFKRSDPPTNADGKYCCNFSNDCSALTFDRKCEWSKHMDKHDRPYRCQDPLCAKLQGFTYSGGLLRHEREVHNKHGGPKEQLMCPVADCKRHSGKGFTRKENLHEHMRRVHDNKSHAIQSPNAPIASMQVNMDGVQGIGENPDMSVSRDLSDMVGPDDLVASHHFGKRRRSGVADAGEVPAGDIDALQHQIKRLREENEEKDKRLRMLEEAATERRQELQGYKDALAQLQQHRDVQSLQNA